MATKRVTRSAYTWRKFFECLRKLVGRADTETYVSTFTTQFGLKPAEYQLGDRRVVL